MLALTDRLYRHIEKLRKAPLNHISLTEDGPRYVEPLGLATANVVVEHLCPVATFESIIIDFLDDIYPIAPVIHIPSFKQRLSSCQYIESPGFLRLCLSICAMTIASMPKKIGLHGFGHYISAKDMVSRACQLVVASRIATSPEWADEPTSNELICSLLLGTASHYTDSPRRGWMFINESIHCCRELNLCSPGGYDGMSNIDREINKRAFWMLYIVQM